ncbi:xylose isomerase domain-containing protein [Nitritalea halalkaliphila LW7]|uniref:Xylose isomerase domain-containing protein n=1 Tax=Nitritalea halalkaliphila LW7 TaxID=1189621 RepID=I5C9A5_9BACT|nr:sugar phosphate isomerase/epimerase [Nitritalea halalkaliphila]EIM78407.1 xylose isomerase domain-containing protein [Nitritalea halalkaliphila LW7]
MQRRLFIKSGSLALAGLGAGLAWSCGPAATSDTESSEEMSEEKSHAHPALGLACFTLPRSLDKDFAGTLREIAAAGYAEIELFGPYAYSTLAAQEAWKIGAGSMGLRGSGYYGLSPKEVRSLLDENGLRAPSIHIELDSLQENMGAIAEAAQIVGHEKVGIAMLPAPMRMNLDGYKRSADIFNEVGAAAQKEGLQFFYHNHGYGHQELEGAIPFDLLLERTDPELVKMQLDIFWFTAAGADPIRYLQEHPKRFVSLHVKDMLELRRFEGDGGSPEEWMSLFPFLTDVGAGVLPLQDILCAAQEAGVQHYFLEKDLTQEPIQAIQTAYAHLSRLDWSCGNSSS